MTDSSPSFAILLHLAPLCWQVRSSHRSSCRSRHACALCGSAFPVLTSELARSKPLQSCCICCYVGDGLDSGSWKLAGPRHCHSAASARQCAALQLLTSSLGSCATKHQADQPCQMLTSEVWLSAEIVCAKRNTRSKLKQPEPDVARSESNCSPRT